MADVLLAVDGLSVAFASAAGPLRALREVSLSVPRGRIVGLVGESGCGKSTLINAVLGLLAANGRVTGGRILFDGQDLLTLGEAGMQRLRGDRISVVFQDPMTALNPVLSVGAQMTAIQYRARRSAAEKRQRAAAMLAKVGIPDPARRLGQYPHEFSGGMRQRICIAMALMAEPDLLIADEPTTALDATLEVQVINLIRNLQRDFHCSILFISHHLGVIAELCDEVVVMYAGEVVEQGDVRDIFRRPAHPYTRKLLECDPARIDQPARQLPVIPGDIPSLLALPSGCVFRDRCDRAIPRCAAEHPALRPVRPGGIAACHRAEEELAGMAAEAAG
ncbi:MAG: ABC transporter ATP-binding protein [Dongiaceae bacterium]